MAIEPNAHEAVVKQADVIMFYTADRQVTHGTQNLFIYMDVPVNDTCININLYHPKVWYLLA
jgi:hypothetical protein